MRRTITTTETKTIKVLSFSFAHKQVSPWAVLGVSGRCESSSKSKTQINEMTIPNKCFENFSSGILFLILRKAEAGLPSPRPVACVRACPYY